MTKEQYKRIADLDADVHNKRLKFQSLYAQNTQGLSADKLKSLSLALHLADSEYLEAKARLGSAKKPAISAQSV